MSDPAIAIVELDSIATGIYTGDAMVKSSPIGSIYAGTVHPGRYLILVSGDTASVEVALETGREMGSGAIVDSIFLPAVHVDVVAAIVSSIEAADFGGDAAGIVETDTVSTVVEAADAGVKAANVTLPAVRLADGLGGKGYAVFSGTVAEVEAAVEAAVARAEPTGHLARSVVIAQIHEEMRQNLADDLRFNQRLARRPEDR
ncbi:MAG: BMC domain-containing protein [Actinomycetota bacterium]